MPAITVTQGRQAACQPCVRAAIAVAAASGTIATAGSASALTACAVRIAVTFLRWTTTLVTLSSMALSRAPVGRAASTAT